MTLALIDLLRDERCVPLTRVRAIIPRMSCVVILHATSIRLLLLLLLLLLRLLLLLLLLLLRLRLGLLLMVAELDLTWFLLLLVVAMVLLCLLVVMRLMLWRRSAADLIRSQLLMLRAASDLLRLVSAMLGGGQVELLLPRINLIILDDGSDDFADIVLLIQPF